MKVMAHSEKFSEIFLDSTKLKIVWEKIATFLKDAFQSYYDLFQVI